MKKVKSKLLKIFISILSLSYVLTFYLSGMLLYYLSKIVRILSFYLMLAPTSAKNELSGFWLIYKAIGDVFPKK